MWKAKKSAKANGDDSAKTNKSVTEPELSQPDPVQNKHLVYFINLMAEQRVTKYFDVAEETTGILRASTEQICNCIALWKGDSTEEDQLMTEDEGMMTEFGMKIYRIGEILGGIQNKNPISFWTNGEKELILSIILPMTKDAVKLRRKLTRISDSMISDLKTLRRLVDIYGCNASDKTTPIQNSDLIEEIDEGSVSEFGFKSTAIKSKTNDKCPNPIETMINFLRSIFTSKPLGRELQAKSMPAPVDSDSYKENNSKASMRTQFSLNSIEFKTPSQLPSEKHLKKIASTLMTSKTLTHVDYILDPIESRVKEVQTFLEVDKWKMMEENILADNPLTSTMSPIVTTEINKQELEEIIETRAKTYFPIKNIALETMQSSSSKGKSREWLFNASEDLPQRQKPIIKNDVQYDREKYIKKIESGNQNEVFDQFDDTGEDKLADNHQAFEEELDSIGISIPKTRGATDLLRFDNYSNISEDREDTVSVVGSGNCENQSEYISVYKSIVKEMHDSVGSLIGQIRSVERAWLTTGLRPGFSGLDKLGDFLDFIGKTVELVGQPDFKGIYQDKKTEVLLALDPVYREAHSCFIALGELAQVVSTDVSYLKELLENFPKGDLIVYEYSSNSSLGSCDKIDCPVQNNDDRDAVTFTVDLDAIFG